MIAGRYLILLGLQGTITEVVKADKELKKDRQKKKTLEKNFDIYVPYLNFK